MLRREGLPTQCGYTDCLGEYPALPDSICVPLITLYGEEGRYTDLGSTSIPSTMRVKLRTKLQRTEDKLIMKTDVKHIQLDTGKLSTSRYPSLVKKISRTSYQEILDFKYVLKQQCLEALSYVPVQAGT